MAMPRPLSPDFLIWLMAMCPKMTPRIDPMPQDTIEEISAAMA
jgi:hypothetical protein